MSSDGPTARSEKVLSSHPLCGIAYKLVQQRRVQDALCCYGLGKAWLAISRVFIPGARQRTEFLTHGVLRALGTQSAATRNLSSELDGRTLLREHAAVEGSE